MKSNNFFLGIIFYFSLFNLNAQNDLFEKATLEYKNGKYNQAIETYKQILKSGEHSADIYYNLGNTYYKLNKIAPSIYYYEKSLMLDPNHQSAKNNLSFAKRMIVDIIEPLPKTVFQKLYEKYIYSISYNNWAWISVLLAFLSSISIILYYLISETKRKKWFFVSGIILLFLFLIAVGLSIKAKHHYLNDNPAIVYEKEVTVQSERGISNIDNFTIHEGTKIQIEITDENWLKIRLENGKTGWIRKQDVRLLKDFKD